MNISKKGEHIQEELFSNARRMRYEIELLEKLKITKKLTEIASSKCTVFIKYDEALLEDKDLNIPPAEKEKLKILIKESSNNEWKFDRKTLVAALNSAIADSESRITEIIQSIINITKKVL